ncbi:MarR family transcriptional regulator [Pseudomonas cedrina subsp. fulgida]|nr:MarR family transcriptional regulator [Pseudomonas cedrina subsp. fulgida]
MTSTKKTANRYDPASENFHKEDFPFYWLAMVHGRYSQYMEKALKKIGLDIPRWRVLLILKENGQSSISEISTHAIAKLSTITKTVYRMKEDGLVDTAPCEDDGRVTQVRITPEGRAAIERIQVATSDVFKRSFTGMTEAQIQRLSRLLETVFDNLGEP